MKRTKESRIKQPTAILTGDWHLRENTPICRTDNFQEAQWRKVRWIAELQARYACPVLHAGDLFDHWKPSPYLLSKALLHLPEGFFTVYGNHDLPQHNISLAEKTGIMVLANAFRLGLLKQGHWREEPTSTSVSFPESNRKVLVWHVMTWKGKEPWPGITDRPAKELLKAYPEYALIVTGHNHKRFVETVDGRLLVNPGSLTRQTADQEDHIPAIYLWYAEDNIVEEVLLPIEQGVISREHIDRIERRDSRIAAFISRLGGEWQTGVSFEDNLERFLSANKIHSSVEKVIRKAVFS